MAVLAQICGLAMVYRDYERSPARPSGMAGFAHIGGHRVCGGFIGGVGPRVTGSAGISGLAVIEWRDQRDPARTSGMTGVAYIGGHRMCGGFIGGISSGMASDATVRGLGVIERRDQRNPYIRGMASLTQFRGLRVRCRFIGSGTDPVVATGAVAGLPSHGAMVEGADQPGGGAVATVARR
jgi:hypothetical protein